MLIAPLWDYLSLCWGMTMTATTSQSPVSLWEGLRTICNSMFSSTGNTQSFSSYLYPLVPIVKVQWKKQSNSSNSSQAEELSCSVNKELHYTWTNSAICRRKLNERGQLGQSHLLLCMMGNEVREGNEALFLNHRLYQTLTVHKTNKFTIVKVTAKEGFYCLKDEKFNNSLTWWWSLTGIWWLTRNGIDVLICITSHQSNHVAEFNAVEFYSLHSQQNLSWT